MRILIVDDHAVLRRGLRDILEEEFPQAEILEAGDAAEALAHVRRGRWVAVVLDITLPGRSGLDALQDIKGMRPDLPVIVLSMHPEDRYAVRALKAGAAGYVTKDTAPQELAGAIRKALDGGTYVSEALAERLAGSLHDGPDAPPHEALSNREHEVLLMVAAGRSISEIAEDLSLSVKTVSTYRTRILKKMGMSTSVELIRYAIEAELTT